MTMHVHGCLHPDDGTIRVSLLVRIRIPVRVEIVAVGVGRGDDLVALVVPHHRARDLGGAANRIGVSRRRDGLCLGRRLGRAVHGCRVGDVARRGSPT